MKTRQACFSLLAVMVAGTLAGCSTRSRKGAESEANLRTAARDNVFITSRTDPRSHCQGYTDVYLQNSSSRPISVDVKRSDQADKQTSIATYTIDPTPTTRSWQPWTGGPRNSELHIGCQFDGTKINTFTITRTDYLR
jgi:hypothetical protein